MIVLYVQEAGKFYYVWVRDEILQLNENRPGWHEQSTVSIRFKNLVGTDSIEAIKSRIVADHRVMKTVMSAAALTSSNARLMIEVVDSEVSTLSVNDVIAQIAEDGLALVSRGLATYVITLVESIPPHSLAMARHHLVAAYA